MKAVVFHRPYEIKVEEVPEPQVLKGYALFSRKEDGCVKVIMDPQH